MRLWMREGLRRILACLKDRHTSVLAPKQYSASAALIMGWVLVICVTPATAHEEGGKALGLMTGLQHPISGLDHVLAMVAVGLWGAQLGPPLLWLLPVTFPIVMAFGGFLGLIGVALPGIEIGIAASAIILGMMITFEAKPGITAAVILVGLFAIFHGHAHGTELPPGESGLSYSIGFVVATGCLHGVGILIGLAHRWAIGQLALRVGGVAIAMSGGLFLWRAVA